MAAPCLRRLHSQAAAAGASAVAAPGSAEPPSSPARICRAPLRSPRRLSPVPPGASHRPRRPRDTRPPAGLGRAGSPAVRRSGAARAEGAGGRRFAARGHHLEAAAATGWQRGGPTTTAGQGRGPAGATAAEAPGQAGSGRRFPQARAHVSALLSRRDPSPWPLPEAGTGPPARPVPAPSPSHSAIARAPAPSQPEAAAAPVRPRPRRCGAVRSGRERSGAGQSGAAGQGQQHLPRGPAGPLLRRPRRSALPPGPPSHMPSRPAWEHPRRAALADGPPARLRFFRVPPRPEKGAELPGNRPCPAPLQSGPSIRLWLSGTNRLTLRCGSRSAVPRSLARRQV